MRRHKVGRRDRLEGLWLELEGERRAAGIGHLHRAVVVPRHQLARKVLKQQGLKVGKTGRKAKHKTPAPGERADGLNQLLERVGAGAAELVGLSARLRVFEGVMQRARDIVDVNRLEAGIRARHGERRSEARKARKLVEELVSRPEDDRRPEHRDAEVFGGEHRPLADAFGAQVLRRGVGGRAQGADMQKTLHAVRPARRHHGLRKLDMRTREVRAVFVRPALPTTSTAAVKDADEVVDRLHPRAETLEYARRHHVGFDDVHGRKEDQVLGALAAARRDCHADPCRRKGSDEVAAQETRAANDEHRIHLHRLSTAALPRRSAVPTPPVAG